jgi:hypothetical protein
VPAVATAVAVGTMAAAPPLFKTLLGLLKTLIGAYIKRWGKKGKKLDQNQRQFMLLGFRLRPAELLALFLAAVVYGLAVCYTLKGWKLDKTLFLRQESLVLVIYYLRSFIRFLFERLFGLVTQFQFWLLGSLLCLFSAYLGNTLSTVGYDMESAQGKEAAERAIKLKVWLLVGTFFVGVIAGVANLLHPEKMLQSARMMATGMALAEVMPVTPLPGSAIYKWRRGVWALLFALVVPSFFLINYVL